MRTRDVPTKRSISTSTIQRELKPPSGGFLFLWGAFAGVQGLVHKISSLITKNKRFREPYSSPYGSEAVHFLYSQQQKFVNKFLIQKYTCINKCIFVCCWGTRARTSINSSRNCCPTIRRYPNVYLLLRRFFLRLFYRTLKRLLVRNPAGVSNPSRPSRLGPFYVTVN